MAGFVPNAWQARLLEATVGRTAIAATQGTPANTSGLYLGLAVAMPENPLTATLANITEVTTAGYARIVVPTFTAATTTEPVKITTPTAFNFAALTADMLLAANYAFLTTASVGTSGDIRYVFELETPIIGRVGEPINVPASTLIIE